MNDDNDLDSIVFSDSNPPADLTFDPFLPGLGQAGDSAASPTDHSNGHDGVSDTETTDDDGIGVIRYGQFGGEGDGEYQQDDDGPLPWQGTGDIPVLGTEERRAREGADTGNRNVRRAAEKHTGVIGPGSNRGTHSPRVDSSISAATERIRADLRVPLDSRERSTAVLKWEADGDKNRKLKRQYQKQGITNPPQFHTTNFEATLTGLKANVSGDWVVTLVVHRDARQAVYSLDDAFGLALDVHVQRKRMRPDTTPE